MKNTMKKIAWLVLTAVLLTCFGLTAGLAEVENFEGTWVSDRCTIEIRPDEEEGYWRCEVAWPNSASENYEWVYTCTYDEATDSLVSDAGALNDVTYDEDGEIVSVLIVYDDAVAKFMLNDDFRLVWQDEKEDAGKDMTFEYVVKPAEAPTVEALAEGYFKVLANLEVGTAGASLKTAIAADAVCHFAENNLLYNPDVDALRANMVEAFDAMGEDEQNAFWQGFDAVRPLLDDCLEDWEANRAQFEDAGVAESMDEIMYDPLNRLAWENLRDHTLTMGNDMNVG